VIVSRLGHGQKILALLALAVAIGYPLMKGDPYWYTVLTAALIYGILALSLDLLWGYTGILNLAPAASFGLGAYAWAVVSTRVDGTKGSWLALLAALAVPALLSAVVAVVSFWAGAREIYFALITLAVGLVLQQVAQVWTGVTGGSNGIIGIAWPTFGIAGVETSFDTPTSFYFGTLAITVAVFLVCLWVVRSRVGAVLKAIRESDRRAETLGYSTLRYRTLASAGSGALAGLAGMLYAPSTGIVDPSVFGVALSVQVLVWVAVGGAGTLLGPLLAAVVISIGQQTLTGSSATAYLLGTGIVFMAIVLFLPGGLASLAAKLQSLRRTAPRPPRPDPAPAVGDGGP
jgi:ABC-type branched-subunit amino acid transport system permease subunit